MRTEPWPADRYSAANGLSLPEITGITQPQQRRNMALLIVKEMRPLQGNSGLCAVVANSDIRKAVIQLFMLNHQLAESGGDGIPGKACDLLPVTCGHGIVWHQPGTADAGNIFQGQIFQVVIG